jgi:hypothetical protein
MNKEDKQQKPTKKAWSIADVIGWLLLVQGFVMAQGSLIWILTDDDTDKWFLRAAMSMICFGFSGVILKK